MPHREVLVVRAALQAALPYRVLAQLYSVRCPAHRAKLLLKGRQVRARSDWHAVAVRVVDMAQTAEVLDLPLTSDELQVTSTPETLKTRAVAPKSRPRVLLVLLNGSLPSRRLSTDAAPDGNSAESFGIKESQPLCNVLGSRGWWEGAASIACAKKTAIVKFFA